MKKILYLVLCVLIIAGLVAVYSGGVSNSKTTSSSQTAVSSSSLAGSENHSATPEEVKYKKEIIVGIEGKLVTWDPQASSIAPMNYVSRMIFDCPMYFDWETQKIVPNIATSWDTTDGMTYTLKLRDDVYFHNGEQLKASDVVFTYERAVGTASSNQLGKMIEKITAVNDFTAEIKLFKVNYDFPYMLTLNTSSILSREAITKNKLNGPEVGTGPYIVDSYVLGDYFTVRRNENFWGEKAKPEKVIFRYMPDKSSRLIALQTGEIDVCQDPELLELSYITDTLGLELQTFDTQSMVYLAVNTQKEPFNNRDFRLAVAHAIDANKLAEVIREGYATDCKSCWGWNQFGYNGGTTDYEYDVKKAKEYVVKAYPSGGAKFEITVMAGERRALGEMVQSQLAAIGVKVTLNEVDHAGLITAQTNGVHEAVFFSFGFNAFADDCRRIFVPGASSNNAHYDNPKVTRLMDLGAAEGNTAKRLEYYKEVQQIVHDDAPYVPLYYPKGSFGVKEGVGGIGYYPTLQHSFRDIYMFEQ